MSDNKQSLLQPVLVRLPGDLRDQVRERASEEDRTQAQVIRRALKMYLAHAPA